ncbi:hypothetical protein AVEN_244987-1 [Araneus ventricosus]|uniref:Uncharacterized protein n=1 Tax=Araneus ventricosus TaxID=182803 RepID=A0A4Y2F3D5_ARAVE|nr:hypothetical protein AVEN_244987-1 [Araneus ventricosus]
MMMIGSSVDYVRSGGMRNVPVTKAVEHLYATTAKFSGCVLLASRPAYSYPPRRITDKRNLRSPLKTESLAEKTLHALFKSLGDDMFDPCKLYVEYVCCDRIGQRSYAVYKVI